MACRHVPFTFSECHGAGQLELVNSGQCVTASDVLADATVRLTAVYKINEQLCNLRLRIMFVPVLK